jgi:hypothetical protein
MSRGQTSSAPPFKNVQDRSRKPRSKRPYLRKIDLLTPPLTSGWNSRCQTFGLGTWNKLRGVKFHNIKSYFRKAESKVRLHRSDRGYARMNPEKILSFLKQMPIKKSWWMKVTQRVPPKFLCPKDVPST